MKENYLTPILDKQGYLRVVLCKGSSKQKRFLIHRLVAIAFIPNPLNKPEINHKNSIKTDNRIENLEWCTRSENTKHAYVSGIKKSPNQTIVFNTENGIFYETIKEAALYNEINPETLRAYLKERIPNKTMLRSAR